MAGRRGNQDSRRQAPLGGDHEEIMELSEENILNLLIQYLINEWISCQTVPYHGSIRSLSVLQTRIQILVGWLIVCTSLETLFDLWLRFSSYKKNSYLASF